MPSDATSFVETEVDTSVVRHLKRAKDLIREPKYWCQNAESRDLPNGVHAYCAVGAIARTTELGTHLFQARNYLDVAAKKLHRARCVVAYNDRPKTKHSGVMRVFDLAIELARKDRA